MKMKQSKMFIPVVVILAGIANSCVQDRPGQDWPQYLGPNRNSTSAQKGILRYLA